MPMPMPPPLPPAISIPSSSSALSKPPKCFSLPSISEEPSSSPSDSGRSSFEVVTPPSSRPPSYPSSTPSSPALSARSFSSRDSSPPSTPPFTGAPFARPPSIPPLGYLSKRHRPTGDHITCPSPPLLRPTTFWKNTYRTALGSPSDAPSSSLIRCSSFLSAGLPIPTDQPFSHDLLFQPRPQERIKVFLPPDVPLAPRALY